MQTMEQIFILLIAFQVKHFLADFIFQTNYMLGKMRLNGWFYPLFVHVIVHASFTLAIIALVNINLWWLALVDLVVHFSMDRIKSSPNMLNRFDFSNRYFWWSLGFDQTVHHLTHYWIIWMLVKA